MKMVCKRCGAPITVSDICVRCGAILRPYRCKQCGFTDAVSNFRHLHNGVCPHCKTKAELPEIKSTSAHCPKCDYYDANANINSFCPQCGYLYKKKYYVFAVLGILLAATSYILFRMDIINLDTFIVVDIVSALIVLPQISRFLKSTFQAIKYKKKLASGQK